MTPPTSDNLPPNVAATINPSEAFPEPAHSQQTSTSAPPNSSSADALTPAPAGFSPTGRDSSTHSNWVGEGGEMEGFGEDVCEIGEISPVAANRQNIPAALADACDKPNGSFEGTGNMQSIADLAPVRELCLRKSHGSAS
jgi:hypothetical protein